MRIFRITMVLMAFVLLILTLSAFTFIPNPKKTHALTPISHSGYKILPGQELVLPFLLKNDPKAKLHITLSKRTLVAFTSCSSSISEREWVSNAFGGTLASYQITIAFCYNGATITSMTTPPRENWSTCCFWGLNSHRAYSEIDMNRGLGIAHGSFSFGGPLNSWSSWVEIDVYNDGSWYGFGG